jgi:hypothetical protein
LAVVYYDGDGVSILFKKFVAVFEVEECEDFAYKTYDSLPTISVDSLLSRVNTEIWQYLFTSGGMN